MPALHRVFLLGGLHFMEKGYKNLCCRIFFFNIFFPFLHLHILPQGQAGAKIGGWQLPITTCPYNTHLIDTGISPPFFLLFICKKRKILCILYFVFAPEMVEMLD